MRKIFLVIFVLFPTISYAEIMQTSDYSSIKREIEKRGKDIIVMFDLDDVLTIPQNEYNISFPERKKHVKKLEKKYGENEAKYFWSIILEDRKIKYVDNKIPDIFEYIKERGIKSIAVTKCFTHKYGKIENAHIWRYNELKALGIDFNQTSPLKGTYKITDIKQKNGRPSSIPMYQNGIIFTARADKGMILERIFAHYNYYPKKILFIDDKYKNLTSIEKLSERYNIKFDGIVITKAHNQKPPNLNSEKEEKRFRILEEEKRWVID